MFEATEMKLATSLCSQEAFVKKKKLLSWLMLRTGCWKFHLRHPQESRGVWKGDEGEDAVRMGVKTKILCYTTALQFIWSWGMCSYIPSFLPQVIINYLIHLEAVQSVRGKQKTCCHSADSQLDKTELDILANRGKEIGRLCWGG